MKKVWEYFKVVDPGGKLRFSALYLDDAIQFVQKTYDKTCKGKQQGTICAIQKATAKAMEE